MTAVLDEAKKVLWQNAVQHWVQAMLLRRALQRT